MWKKRIAASYWLIRGLASWLKLGFYMLLTSWDLFIQSVQHALQESSSWVGKNLNRQNVTLIPAKHADKAFVPCFPTTASWQACVSCWARLQQELLIMLQWEADRKVGYNTTDFHQSTTTDQHCEWLCSHKQSNMPLHKWLSRWKNI